MLRRWSAVTLCMVLSVCSLPAPARAFYCGRRLVRLGDPQYQVQQICGAPADRQWRVTYHARSFPDPFSGTLGVVYEPVVTEVWRCDFGPQRFVQEVTFDNGNVVAVRPLRYGSE